MTLPPSMRTRLGKVRMPAYLVLICDLKGDWQASTHDKVAAAMGAWEKRGRRPCCVLRWESARRSWTAVKERGPEPLLDELELVGGAERAQAVVISDVHGMIRSKYFAHAASAEAFYATLPYSVASGLFVRGGGAWNATKTYGTPSAAELIRACAGLCERCSAVALARCWEAPGGAAHTHAGVKAASVPDATEKTPALATRFKSVFGPPRDTSRSGAPDGVELYFVACPLGVEAGGRVAFVTPSRRFAVCVVPRTIYPTGRFVASLASEDGEPDAVPM